MFRNVTDLNVKMNSGESVLTSGGGLKLGFIQKGKPTQNAFIERFNRSYCQEIPDAYLFDSLKGISRLTQRWVEVQNSFGPWEP